MPQAVATLKPKPSTVQQQFEPVTAPASAVWADPPFWRADLPLAAQVERLTVLAPARAAALAVLVEALLRETWWQTARTQDGLRTLAALAEGRR